MRNLFLYLFHDACRLISEPTSPTAACISRRLNVVYTTMPFAYVRSVGFASHGIAALVNTEHEGFSSLFLMRVQTRFSPSFFSFIFRVISR